MDPNNDVFHSTHRTPDTDADGSIRMSPSLLIILHSELERHDKTISIH
jgi:hypothetical protein